MLQKVQEGVDKNVLPVWTCQLDWGLRVGPSVVSDDGLNERRALTVANIERVVTLPCKRTNVSVGVGHVARLNGRRTLQSKAVADGLYESH